MIIITCEPYGARQYSSKLRQGGHEVPFMLEANGSDINRVPTLITSANVKLKENNGTAIFVSTTAEETKVIDACDT